MAEKNPNGSNPGNHEPDYDEKGKSYASLPKEIHVVGTTAFILVATKAAMDARVGRTVTHLKVKTFEEEGKVRFTYVPGETEGATRLRLNKQMTAAQLAFAVSLRKLHIKLAEDRMLAFTKVTETVTEKGEPAWEVTLKDSETRPRDVDPVAITLKRQVKAAKERARREARRRRLAEQANLPYPPEEPKNKYEAEDEDKGTT